MRKFAQLLLGVVCLMMIVSVVSLVVRLAHAAGPSGDDDLVIGIPLSLSGTNPFVWTNAWWWTNASTPTNLQTWQAWWAISESLKRMTNWMETNRAGMLGLLSFTNSGENIWPPGDMVAGEAVGPGLWFMKRGGIYMGTNAMDGSMNDPVYMEFVGRSYVESNQPAYYNHAVGFWNSSEMDYGARYQLTLGADAEGGAGVLNWDFYAQDTNGNSSGFAFEMYADGSAEPLLYIQKNAENVFSVSHAGTAFANELMFGAAENTMAGIQGYPSAMTNISAGTSPVGKFGYLAWWGDTAATADMAAADYTNISLAAGTNFTRVLTNGFGYNETLQCLQVGTTGFYGIRYGATFDGSAGILNDDIEVEVFITPSGEAAVNEEHLSSHISGAAVNNHYGTSGGGVMYLPADTLVELRIKNTSGAGTDDVDFRRVWLSVGAP